MGKQMTQEELGQETKKTRSEEEVEIQQSIDAALAFMDDNPHIMEMHVSCTKPFVEFLETMFPGIQNVSKGLVSSTMNSLHLQIRHRINRPREGFLRIKLFKCDLDVIINDTPNFLVYRVPMHDKARQDKVREAKESGDGTFFDEDDTKEPKRLAVSMIYDLTRSYSEQIVEFQKEVLDLTQQYCDLQEISSDGRNNDIEF
jgi:hypothetical protein